MPEQPQIKRSEDIRITDDFTPDGLRRIAKHWEMMGGSARYFVEQYFQRTAEDETKKITLYVKRPKESS